MRDDQRQGAQANLQQTEPLSGRFWLATAATGIAAGVGAIALMAVLRAVQHAAFSYHTGEYSTAVAAHSDLRRVVVLAIGGLVGGTGWWAIRRHLGGVGPSPTAVVWSRRGKLSLPRISLSGALSEVVIGLGGSIGRENAPQHAGAASGDLLARRLGLPAEQRTLLIACGAGAGVGAVYNVPLAGALFACELYLGSITLRNAAPALVTSAIATAIGWLALPMRPIYQVPQLGFPSLSLLIFSLVAGPLIGVLAVAWVKLVAFANDRRPTGGGELVALPLAFVALGLLSIAYPLLLGNGRDLAQFAFTGTGALSTLVALAVLKPVVTSMCLGSGASGGLFTPTMSFGAVAGAAFGHVWASAWPGANAAAYGVAGSAAMLAAGMQAPFAAIAFAIELTNTVNASMVALVLCAGVAMLVARRLDGRTIYSARLPRDWRGEATPKVGQGSGPAPSPAPRTHSAGPRRRAGPARRSGATATGEADRRA